MKKLGLILDLKLNSQFNWAQGPQVVKYENFTRVYFSTRISEGKYFYSDVAYVDFDKTFQRVINFSNQPVLVRSKPGNFDHDGVFPFHVKRLISKDNRIVGLICGWKRKVSVDIDMSVGISESFDGGKTFTRLGDGPIMGANTFDPFLVGDPFIFESPQCFYLAYIKGENWVVGLNGVLERKYRIAFAKSVDLIEWEALDGIRIPARLENEAQAMPSLIQIDDVFHLIYCYRDVFDFRYNSRNSYRIGHSYSKDLVDWKISEFMVPLGEHGDWDADMQCYPHIFTESDRAYILYNGNDFGKFGIGLLELDSKELVKYAKF